MRRLMVVTPAFVLMAACGSGPTPQEQNLSERGEAPEQMANATTVNTADQSLGDTLPDNAAGPVSDRGSGTGGDSVPSQ